MPKLVFHDSDGVDKTLQLGTEPITIGRASDCEVQTHDAMVSRKHARIIWDGGAYWVEDLGSSNGVFLGQDKVQRAAFRPGDVVTCGSLVMRMVPEARRTAPPNEPEPKHDSPKPTPLKPEPRPPRNEAAEEWDKPLPTSASPALAGAGAAGELQRLRADLQRESERREAAEAALLSAEQRIANADEVGREIILVRRRLEQREAEIRRLQEQSVAAPPAPVASPIDLNEVAEAVAVFNDVLAELKASLRAAVDESLLLTTPPESVKLVRDSLRSAMDELERARQRLRQMVKTLGLPEA